MLMILSLTCGEAVFLWAGLEELTERVQPITAPCTRGDGDLEESSHGTRFLLVQDLSTASCSASLTVSHDLTTVVFHWTGFDPVTSAAVLHHHKILDSCSSITLSINHQ